MDIETIIYIAIFIIFSLFSGKKNKEKKRQREKGQESDAPDVSLEEELRRMADRMMGKTTEAEKPAPAPTPEPEYKAEERRPQYAPAYEKYVPKNYDKDAGNEPVVDYSANDIETLREYNERIKAQKYEAKVVNFDTKRIDDLKKGQDQHSVMNHSITPITVLEEPVEAPIDFSDFDARKAIIYAEIFKRPEY